MAGKRVPLARNGVGKGTCGRFEVFEFAFPRWGVTHHRCRARRDRGVPFTPRVGATWYELYLSFGQTVSPDISVPPNFGGNKRLSGPDFEGNTSVCYPSLDNHVKLSTNSKYAWYNRKEVIPGPFAENDICSGLCHIRSPAMWKNDPCRYVRPGKPYLSEIGSGTAFGSEKAG